MTEDQFWQIIQRSFDACDGDLDEQAETLAGELEPLSVEEIESFDQHFSQFSRQAYTWDLWGAAYIINGGCSDDGFQYFRWWLISRGRDCFFRALNVSDSLVEYPGDLVAQGTDFEDIAYVADRVCKEKSGDFCVHDVPPPPSEPAGDPWPQDDEETFRVRWPKLFARILECLILGGLPRSCAPLPRFPPSSCFLRCLPWRSRRNSPPTIFPWKFLPAGRHTVPCRREGWRP